MTADSPAERWRSWPREGDRITAPDDSTMDERLAAMVGADVRGVRH
jgi:hypothetical protein